jgi:CO/xanthine dehydrogenase Mo-binding subunit
MTDNSRMTRRHFLVSVAAVGGGLVLGVALPKVGRAAGEIETGSYEVNAWVIVQPDNTVIIRVARSEMGQGILTALPMLVAEELACDWAKVRAEYAAPEENLRRNRVFGPMLTGGSRSVRESQEYLRRAGAAAREMLIAAAASRWGVPATDCAAALGLITHIPSGRTVTFGRWRRLPPDSPLLISRRSRRRRNGRSSAPLSRGSIPLISSRARRCSALTCVCRTCGTRPSGKAPSLGGGSPATMRR